MIVDTHECMNPAEGYITIDLVYRKAYQKKKQVTVCEISINEQCGLTQCTHCNDFNPSITQIYMGRKC